MATSGVFSENECLAPAAGASSASEAEEAEVPAARGAGRGAAVLLLGTAALVALAVGSLGRAAAPVAGDVAQAVRLEELEEQGGGCAGEAEDCSISQCCKDASMQCFAKNADWAACLPPDACVPGVHEGDADKNPWSCARLGAEVAVEAGWAASEAFAWKVVAKLSDDVKIALMSGTDGGQGYAGFVNAWVGDAQAALTMNDGPQGYNAYQERLSGLSTQYPCLLALAAGFDPTLAGRYANAVAEEFVAKGSNTMLGPDVEVTRTTLSGRSYESLSGEDPFLGSTLVKPFVRAVQAKGVISVVKHWLDNNQEIYRQSMTATVSDRTNHEIYMPVFKAAFDAGAAGVMCAYNKVNGTFACENEKLLKKLLREDLGFRGFVVSDWGATHDGAKSLNAGLDIEMPLGKHMSGLTTEFFKHKDMKHRVDEAAARVVAAMHFVGHFAGSFPADYLPAGLLEVDGTSDAHRRVAFDTIISSAVLLKNKDMALPMVATKGKTIAVIGTYCDALKDPNYKQGSVWGGGGSGYVDTSKGTTPLQGIREHIKDATIRASVNGAAAKGADLAVLCVAGHGEEGWDRDNLTLPGVEALIRDVRRYSSTVKVVVVAAVPGAVETEWVEDVDAALILFMPGEQVGPVVARLLTGEATPSGRLPLSFPKVGEQRWTQKQYPGWCDDVKGGWCDHMEANFSEGTLVGYRWNDATATPSAFPFGFGLSYAEFLYSGFTAECGLQGAIIVQADVTNIGKFTGSAVPQLYVGFPSLRPVLRQLRGFTKIELKPGTVSRITFVMNEADWSYFDESKDAWVVADKEPITVSIGDSSADLKFTHEMNCAIQGDFIPIEVKK